MAPFPHLACSTIGATFAGREAVEDGIWVAGFNDTVADGDKGSVAKVIVEADEGTPGSLHADKAKQSQKVIGKDNPFNFIISPHQIMTLQIANWFPEPQGLKDIDYHPLAAQLISKRPIPNKK
jgi:hypothetical protein